MVRNGYHHECEVITCACAVSATAPRVIDKSMDPDTGKRKRFVSATHVSYSTGAVTKPSKTPLAGNASTHSGEFTSR